MSENKKDKPCPNCRAATVENLAAVIPRFGKTGYIFSNGWKNLAHFAESKSLESEIKKQLAGLRYE